MTVWGVVVAAGSGSRFGGEKQHLELDGRPIWRWAQKALLAGGAESVVIVGPVPGGVPGGARRRDSVRAGLEQIPEAVEFVLVHDAARPLAGADLVGSVIDRLEQGDVDAVVPVVPVRDTLKELSGSIVIGTQDRSNLAIAQTPQGFRLAALREAHRTVTGDASDDASMIEEVGGKVASVAGDPRNLKLTYPEDLALMKALL